MYYLYEPILHPVQAYVIDDNFTMIYTDSAQSKQTKPFCELDEIYIVQIN